MTDSVTDMRDMTRTWPALCALGAGLVHLAISASSPWWWALALISIGALEVAWSLAYLIRGAPFMPRAMLAVSLAPVAVLGSLVVLGLMTQHASAMTMHAGMTAAVTLPVLPFSAATALNLVVAGRCAVQLRRNRTATAQSVHQPGPVRAITGILLGAALVALITVPALGSTDAGHEASMHMTM